MARAAPTEVVQSQAFGAFPIHMAQRSAPTRGNSRLVLVIPAVSGRLALVGGVAIAATAEPAMLGILAERPFATAQIIVGMSLLLGLIVIPVDRMAAGLWRRHQATVTRGHVELVERTPLGRRTRVIPVSDYQGIAHHIRSSVAGLTHELMLIHKDPSLTITIASGDQVTTGGLESAKVLLGLPEIPAHALNGRGRVSTRLSASSGI